MNSQQDQSGDKGSQGPWQKLWEKPASKWLFGIPLGAFLFGLLGVMALGTFQTALSYSNSNELCYSCHIGMDTIVEEYEASVHFNNPSGVQAQCSDCHVPKEFFPKMYAKIRATKDFYLKAIGSITLENFEENRLRLAEHVWENLEATDSRECRNCHKADEWNIERQKARSRTNHDPASWAEKGETCIDCHYGVAHKIPQGI